VKGWPVVRASVLYSKSLEHVTHVIVHILATNVEHCTRKVAISHLEAKIECPQRRAKTVTDPWETTTGSCIGLHHYERLSIGLCEVSGVEIGSNDIDARGMVEVVLEHILRVNRSADTIGSVAVVSWVTCKTSDAVQISEKGAHCSTASHPKLEE
jgi:hypothetical protein